MNSRIPGEGDAVALTAVGTTAVENRPEAYVPVRTYEAVDGRLLMQFHRSRKIAKMRRPITIPGITM